MLLDKILENFSMNDILQKEYKDKMNTKVQPEK